LKRPTIKGCAGALVAVALVGVATIIPSTLGELAPLPRIETFISKACGGASPCTAPDRARWLAQLDKHLRAKMPGLPAEDRSRLASVIYEEAKAASLDPFFVLAVIAVESGFDHDAESAAGAKGLMQLTPSTLKRETQRWRFMPSDLDDPVVNVQAGVRYLRRLVRMFGSTDVALMAYNAGPNRILKYLEDEGDIPDRFLTYPKKVNGELKRLRKNAPPLPAAGPVAALGADPARPERQDGPATEAGAIEAR
jgi:soluble lytic murein transglycosylase-like protein